MISLASRFQRVPEADRVHAVRLCRSVLEDSLLEVLDDERENPIFKSKLASVLARRIRELGELFPEADDDMPMRTVMSYTHD